MATLSIILDQRRTKRDGSFPLKIRISHNKKAHLHSLGISILPKQWDVSKFQIKQHTNCKLLNAKLNKQFTWVEQKLLDLERTKPIHTIQDIKGIFKPQKVEKEEKFDIVKYGYKLIEQQNQSGRYGNANTYKKAIERLRKFSPSKLAFENITYQFLCDWETAMRKEGVKVNSVGAYMRSIRAIYNQAIKSNIVDAKHYPFTNYKIKSEKTAQRTLSKSQIQQIEQLTFPKESAIEKAKNIFLLSFYLRGINFRDLAMLTTDNIHGDRIIYKRQKTHKIYSIKLVLKASSIIDHYKEQNEPFLLPIISNKYKDDKEFQYLSAREMIKNYNKRYYHKIGKLIGEPKMTTYYARYSWANIARKLGYSKDLIAEALGHEYGNKVTGIYLDNYDLEVIDEMNEKVCE